MDVITLEALQALDAIDRRGSFAAAAGELHKVPSALSYTIKQLEEQLGVDLFDRSRQRAQLTETGRMVLKQGRELLRGAEMLAHQARQAATGWEPVLRIVVESILPMSPLWPVITDFAAEHPSIEIDLREEALSGSWEALADQRADLLIGVTETEPAGVSAAKEKLGDINFQLVCAPEHPLAHLPAAARTEESLLSEAQIVLRDSARRLPARSVGLYKVRRQILVDHYYAKEQAILAGLGFGFLPQGRVKQFIDAGRLVTLDQIKPAFSVPIYMAWNKQGSGNGVRWMVEQIARRQSFSSLLS